MKLGRVILAWEPLKILGSLHNLPASLNIWSPLAASYPPNHQLSTGPVGPLGSTKNHWVPISFLYAVTMGEKSQRDRLGGEEGGHLERTGRCFYFEIICGRPSSPNNRIGPESWVNSICSSFQMKLFIWRGNANNWFCFSALCYSDGSNTSCATQSVIIKPILWPQRSSVRKPRGTDSPRQNLEILQIPNSIPDEL